MCKRCFRLRWAYWDTAHPEPRSMCMQLCQNEKASHRRHLGPEGLCSAGSLRTQSWGDDDFKLKASEVQQMCKEASLELPLSDLKLKLLRNEAAITSRSGKSIPRRQIKGKHAINSSGAVSCSRRRQHSHTGSHTFLSPICTPRNSSVFPKYM